MFAQGLGRFSSILTTLWYKLRPGISVGRNSRIWPSTILKPPVVIDDNVEIGRPSETGGQCRLLTCIGPNSRVRRNAILYEGTVFGENASIGHNVVIRERSVFGSDAYIKANTYVGVDVVAGDNVTVAHLVGDRARLGHDVTTLGVIIHASKGLHRGESEPAPKVSSGAFIGRLAVVAGSVSIGSGAFVNAGAMVKNDVPDGAHITSQCKSEGYLSNEGEKMKLMKRSRKQAVIVTERRIQRKNSSECLHAHFRSVDTGIKRPVVIFSHGFTVDGLESHRLFLNAALELNRRGFSTVLFDYPGIGWSDGEYVDFRLSKAPLELITVVEATLEGISCNGTVVIFGQSLGTAVAVLAEHCLRDRCVGMTLWNLSADISNRYPRVFGAGIAESDSYCIPNKGLIIGKSFIEDTTNIDIIGTFRDWQTPVLLLNAGADEKSSVEYAQQAAENCEQSLVTRIVVDGANHSFKCQPELEREAILATVDWIEALPTE